MEKFKLAIVLTIICVAILVVIYLIVEKLFERMRQNVRARVKLSVVNRLLSTLNSRKYILIRGILLPTLVGNVLVDHVVVSTYGIFLVEAIDWGGKVQGTRNDLNWNHVDSAGNELSPENPMIQNAVEMVALQELLGLGFDDFIPILAFVSAVDLDLNVDIPVANINNLIKIIKSHRDKRFTRKQALYLANEIRMHNISMTKNTD